MVYILLLFFLFFFLVLKTVILDFVTLPGSHTGDNIADKFKGIIDQFGIKDLLSTVTTDNATNNDTFIQRLLDDGYLKSPEHHIRCFGHVINLAAQAAFEELKDSFSALRTNLSKVKFIFFILIIRLKEPL